MKLLTTLLLAITASGSAKAYWQQKVDTRIEVRLDDRQHMLSGQEQISYTNNSPDTLRFLYLHLWPNGYKDDRTAFSEQQVQQGNTSFYYAPEQQQGFIDSLHFSIGTEAVDYYFVGDNADMIRIDLPEALTPGGHIDISTPFRVKLPKVFSRLGHTGQAYFISQWFPKPAVYDRKGWHQMPYLNQGEFYSETGSYDVSITVPDNYIVMATGNCQDAAENNWLDSLSRLPLPSDTLYKRSWPASSATTKTLHFTEDNIHDFAWFADKRWVVRKDTVSGNGSEGTTTLYTAFLPYHAAQWKKGTDYLRQTVRSYGNWVGAYPYQTIKAVDGDMNAGGGMEYPTVTVIDRGSLFMLQTVLIHEAGHNWFYGILGTNEREHAWMDEGLNSFYERKTSRQMKITDSSTATGKEEDALENATYFQAVAMAEDQPIEQHAALFSASNYGGDIYFKSALMLRWLEAYMGAAVFEQAIQDYFTTWKFKHPYPEDFRAILEKHTDKSLDWFFNGALTTRQPVDFKIQSVHRKGDELEVTIKNKSDFPAPVQVNTYSKDSLQSGTWTAPFSGTQQIRLAASDWSTVSLGGNYADIKHSNDHYNRSGLFHKGGLHLKGPLGLNHSNKENLFLAPALGINEYDGFGLGIALHNLSWPQRRFQLAIAPLYSFGSKRLNGLASVAYSWYPHRIFKEIRLQTNVKTFSYAESELNIPDPLYARYFKVAPSLAFIFRERDPLSKVRRTLTFRQYSITEESFSFSRNLAVDSLYRPSIQSEQHFYGLLSYEHLNERTFHPFSYTGTAQLGKDFAKLGLEAKMRIDYDIPHKSFYIRGFAGKYISIHNTPESSRYYLNTTYSGVNDYLYDGTFYGRTETGGMSSRQVSMQEGGFKIPTLMYANQLGRSDDWILTFNLKTDLPLKKLPLRLYLDIGTFADAKNVNPDANTMSYNGGLELHLFHELLSVYAPLVLSQDYSNYLDQDFGNKKGSSRFLRGLSFSLNIQNFNFMRLPEKAYRLGAQ